MTCIQWNQFKNVKHTYRSWTTIIVHSISKMKEYITVISNCKDW